MALALALVLAFWTYTYGNYYTCTYICVSFGGRLGSGKREIPIGLTYLWL